MSVVSFVINIIFSHSKGCLIVLFVVSLVVKAFKLNRGSFCDLCQRVYCVCFPLKAL